MQSKSTLNGRFLATTALTLCILAPTAANAQQADEGSGGLTEIIVTAQKREQSVQDVPIAVTAITAENLQANRILTVNDLSAIAPGVTVRPSAGGIQTPFFTIRGSASTGVVAGQDKTVSIYLDGVYISSPRGSIFDLPDVERLEVLRGPQGTLFGRNATGGAVSVTTRDPSGDPRAKLEGSVGNYGAYRIRATVETPQVGPFSGLFSFVRNYRRGEIENSFAGTVWDRNNSPSKFGVAKSPRWLGTTDTKSYFAAVKFEPSDSFKTVYKYDRSDDSGTPEGTAIVAYNKSIPLFSSVLGALFTSNNVHFDPSARRPKIVDNGWAVPRQQRVQGHSLTSTWTVSDSVTVKNVAAYRKAFVFSPSPIDGVSSLNFTSQTLVPFATLSAFSLIGTPTGTYLGITDVDSATAAIPGFISSLGSNVGKRVVLISSQASSIAKQYSDEIQINYSSEKLQATVGALWFHSNDQSGGPEGQQNTLLPITILPTTGIIPLANEGRSFNKATSLAAYAQLEYKITPELELVAGARITKDKKTSALRWDINSQGVVVVPTNTIIAPAYKKTKPNFLVGLNWKPDDNTLVYGKYSTSFVSGGTTYGIAYAPETAESFELGLKADMLDRKLRTNLALYNVKYKNLQQSQGTSTTSSAAIAVAALTPFFGATTAQQLTSVISTFVYGVGDMRSRGIELEVTAAPARGLTMGGSISYSDSKYTRVDPIVLSSNGGTYRPTNRPKWTGSVYAAYETEPLFGDATLLARMDGLYQSKNQIQSKSLAGYLYSDSSNANVYAVPSYWLVNGRIALRHLELGPAKAELALWGKNLTDRKYPAFALEMGILTSANFIPPRTYGLELSVEF